VLLWRVVSCSRPQFEWLISCLRNICTNCLGAHSFKIRMCCIVRIGIVRGQQERDIINFDESQYDNWFRDSGGRKRMV